MCVVCRATNHRNPSPYFRSDCGGGLIRSRVNQITGQLIPVEPWVNSIHPEDWEWYEQFWAEYDVWDWRFEIEIARGAA